jgi:hypothetical protein
MTKTFGLALAASAIALAACSSGPSPTPMGSAGAAAQAPAAGTPPAAPAAPPVPPPQLAALPDQGCVAPPAGTMTIRRGETASRGSMQVYYTGRDETYRTDPYVYMFESNAPLRNRSNTRREGRFFGLWRGQTQTAEACGHTVRLSLVRATPEAATISVRR